MQKFPVMRHNLPFILIAVLVFSGAGMPAFGGVLPDDNTLYIDPQNGDDEAKGTAVQPLRSLPEAAKRVNAANGKGAITVVLSEGIHNLSATATFHPVNWRFSATERLTIRAAVLPDDSLWNPARMPVIISTMPLDFKPNGNNDPFGGASYGIQIETSHVTIQGLRVLGTPVHESPAPGIVRRNYPIVREGRSLDDLRVTQCLFLGDPHAIPNHVAILASGHGVQVDHCVFFRVKDAVVFWFSDRPAEHCQMHHNLIIDSYGAAVWTWSPAADFSYFNNVVSGANVFWVLNQNESTTYTLSHSLLLGYENLVTKGGGPLTNVTPGNAEKLKFGKDVILQKGNTALIEMDPTSPRYLHLKEGSPGFGLGTGLFFYK